MYLKSEKWKTLGERAHSVGACQWFTIFSVSQILQVRPLWPSDPAPLRCLSTRTCPSTVRATANHVVGRWSEPQEPTAPKKRYTSKHAEENGGFPPLWAASFIRPKGPTVAPTGVNRLWAGGATLLISTYTVRNLGVVAAMSDTWPAGEGQECCNPVNPFSRLEATWPVRSPESSCVVVLVADTEVILVGLIHPVEPGENVTLLCRVRSPSSSTTAVFYKDGNILGSDNSASMTLYHVSRYDEGHYRCHISGHGDSPTSFLLVRGINNCSSCWLKIQLTRPDFWPDLTLDLTCDLTWPDLWPDLILDQTWPVT